MKTTDLNEPSTPEEIPAVLRYAAEKMLEQSGELQAAWQDRTAGNVWTMIAAELERCAARIEKKL